MLVTEGESNQTAAHTVMAVQASNGFRYMAVIACSRYLPTYSVCTLDQMLIIEWELCSPRRKIFQVSALANTSHFLVA